MLELQGSSMAMTFLVWFFGLILALVENIKIFQKIVVGCESKKDNDHVRRGKMDQWLVETTLLLLQVFRLHYRALLLLLLLLTLLQVFRLHYRATVALLLGSSLVGVAKQYFGDPINCQVTLCEVMKIIW